MTDIKIASAKTVGFSSVVGQLISLHNADGRHIGQLAIHGLPVDVDYKDGSQDIAQQVIAALEKLSR